MIAAYVWIVRLELNCTIAMGAEQMETRISSEIAITEPIAIQDVFCMGIASIEIMGPNARFFMYADQTPVGGGPVERHIVAKLVLPIENIPECIRKAIEATASHTVVTITKKIEAIVQVH
jgi:hypothetical protein